MLLWRAGVLRDRAERGAPVSSPRPYERTFLGAFAHDTSTLSPSAPTTTPLVFCSGLAPIFKVTPERARCPLDSLAGEVGRGEREGPYPSVSVDRVRERLAAFFPTARAGAAATNTSLVSCVFSSKLLSRLGTAGRGGGGPRDIFS